MGRPVPNMSSEKCPGSQDHYQHCWHETGAMKLIGTYHEVCCWCGGERWAIKQPLEGPHGPHLTKWMDPDDAH